MDLIILLCIPTVPFLIFFIYSMITIHKDKKTV